MREKDRWHNEINKQPNKWHNIGVLKGIIILYLWNKSAALSSLQELFIRIFSVVQFFSLDKYVYVCTMVCVCVFSYPFLTILASMLKNYS